MGRDSLRTIAFAYRDIQKKTSDAALPLKEDGTPVIPGDDLILVAIMGIKVGGEGGAAVGI